MNNQVLCAIIHRSWIQRDVSKLSYMFPRVTLTACVKLWVMLVQEKLATTHTAHSLSKEQADLSRLKERIQLSVRWENLKKLSRKGSRPYVREISWMVF